MLSWRQRYANDLSNDLERRAYFAELTQYYTANPDKTPHGTGIGYACGKCRCDSCKEANNTRHKNWKSETLEILKSDTEHPFHGTLTGHQVSCPCESCRKVGREYDRARVRPKRDRSEYDRARAQDPDVQARRRELARERYRKNKANNA